MIDDEMRDMLLMSKDTRGAIREMNDAFKGESDLESQFVAEEHNNKLQVRKVITRKRTLDRLATAKGRPLEPIMEERLYKDQYALVAVDTEQQKRVRNESLKHKARLISGTNRSTTNSNFRFGEEDTFLTGGGLPGRRQQDDEDDE